MTTTPTRRGYSLICYLTKAVPSAYARHRSCYFSVLFLKLALNRKNTVRQFSNMLYSAFTKFLPICKMLQHLISALYAVLIGTEIASLLFAPN